MVCVWTVPDSSFLPLDQIEPWRTHPGRSTLDLNLRRTKIGSGSVRKVKLRNSLISNLILKYFFLPLHLEYFYFGRGIVLCDAFRTFRFGTSSSFVSVIRIDCFRKIDLIYFLRRFSYSLLSGVFFYPFPNLICEVFCHINLPVICIPRVKVISNLFTLYWGVILCGQTY